MVFKCFSEPTTVDNTWASHGEPIASWLGESTLPRAREIRAFINRNIACLPADMRSEFCHAIKTRWSSGFFELVVARSLQVLGADPKFEQEDGRGHRPDFVADFQGQAVVVEAMAPQFDLKNKQEEKAHDEVMHLIESRIPEGWSVLLESLPVFGASESKASLKRALDDFFSTPLTPDDDWRRVHIRLQKGPIKFVLLHGTHGQSNIVGGPFYVAWSDSEQRIRHALRKKKRQVRGHGLPAILAIHATGLVSDLDDFDAVLFGRSVTRLGPSFEPQETFFDHSGEFAKGRASAYAAVWAFIGVSPFGCQDSVLYVRPLFQDRIPKGFEASDQRLLTPTGIEVIPGKNTSFLGELGWAKFAVEK